MKASRFTRLRRLKSRAKEIEELIRDGQTAAANTEIDRFLVFVKRFFPDDYVGLFMKLKMLDAGVERAPSSFLSDFPCHRRSTCASSVLSHEFSPHT